MRAAVYIRVSSKKQAEQGLSLDDQERRCREFIAAKGWSLADAHFYREEGLKGTDRSRPALAQLVRAIECAEVDVLVSPWIDRIGRSAQHSEQLFETFDRAGIDLWDPNGQRFSGDSATAKFTRRMLAGAAEFERDMLSERVAAVTEAKAERGSYHGGIPPYGYAKGEHGGLVEHPSEARWVRHLFKRYVDDGWTLYAIADELAAQGAPVKRGGKWNSHRIAERLDNPIYVGRVKFGATGRHPALIDDRTWRLAQERRAATKALDGNGRGVQPSIHLLSHGKLLCACGAKLRPRRDSGSGRRTYRCETQLRKGSTCPVPALPQELLDGAVLHYLAHDVVSPGLTARELASRQKSALFEERHRKADAERRSREAADNLEGAEIKWIEGKMPDDRWEHWRARFEQDRLAAEQEATAATATIQAIENPDPDTVSAVERLRADLHSAAADPDALARYRQLVLKLFTGFELIQAPADAPEHIEDFPSTPTFAYRQPALRRGTEREHRYYLLPILRPDLAAIYGAGDPMTPMPDGLLAPDLTPAVASGSDRTDGQADATGRRLGLRPHGARRAGRRRRAPHHERLPLERRAGCPLRRAPRPEVGRAAGQVAAPPRHRARPRPARRVRLARGQREAVRLRPEILVGALALRLHPQRRHAQRRLRPARRPERDAELRPAALRTGHQPRRPALERRRRPPRRAALRRVELQPVRAQPRRRAGHRAVHAGNRRGVRGSQPVRRR